MYHKLVYDTLMLLSLGGYVLFDESFFIHLLYEFLKSASWRFHHPDYRKIKLGSVCYFFVELSSLQALPLML